MHSGPTPHLQPCATVRRQWLFPGKRGLQMGQDGGVLANQNLSIQWPECRDTGCWSWEHTGSGKCALLPFSSSQLLHCERRQKELSALIMLLWIPCFSSVHCFLHYYSLSCIGCWVKKYPGSSATCAACLHGRHRRGTASCRLLRSCRQPEHHIHVLELLLWRSRGKLSLQAGTYCFDPHSREICKVHWKLGWRPLLPCSISLWVRHWKPAKREPVLLQPHWTGKGRSGSIPGLSTILTIDESRPWIHRALSLRPRARREDSLPTLSQGGQLCCGQSQPPIDLGCQTLSHLCGSITLLWDWRQLISEGLLLCKRQLWSCFFCE